MPRLALALLAVGLATLAADPTAPPAAAQEKKQKKKVNDATPPAAVAEDDARVLPVFDPGSHTQPISGMGFTKDGAKLVTVGGDFTVQVWSAATGDRLDLFRLPGYGREKGFDPGRWDVAAVSPDGTLAAVGGQTKYLHDHVEKATAPCRLVLVHLARHLVAKVDMPGNTDPVTGLAFAPDGDTLAIALGRPGRGARLLVVGGLARRLAAVAARVLTPDCRAVDTPHRTLITALAFAPDGRRLLLGEEAGQRLTVWDVPAGAAPVPTIAHPIDAGAHTLGVGWSPDGTRFVHSVKDNDGDGRTRGFDIRTAAGELVKAYRIADLGPALRPRAYALVFGVRYLNPTTIYFLANAAAGSGTEGGGPVAGVLDLTTGKARRLAAHPEGQTTGPTGAATADGTRLAYTVVGNTEALVVPAGGGSAVRCGQRTPIPYYVGWSNDPARPGFAWTDDRQTRKTQERDSTHLRHGFDLAAMEPIGTVAADKYDTARWTLGEWTIKIVGTGKKGADDGQKGAARLMKGDAPVAGLPLRAAASRTLIPTADGPPRLAYSTHQSNHCERAAIYKSDGTLLTRLLPDASNFTDMASSADGRFLVVATGTPRLVVYRSDGSPYPLLSFAMLNGEWVCWTPEGYYAASPGGEKLFGFAVNNGPNALVTFHPAEKFAKQYRRPDVIRLAIEKGSVAEALETLAAAPAPLVETILPPAARVELVEQRGTTVKVKATANSGAKDKPVLAMRVLLDGRPLADGKGVWTPVPGPAAAAEFEFEVPAGAAEVKVLARSADGAAVSDPLVVRRPKPPGSQPTVYRVCVGVNEYDDPGLKLAAAAKDAGDFFKAVEAHCVGSNNRFGAAAGDLLTDKAATRSAVLTSLAAVRKKARPGDLLVVFFAGHGVKAEGGFYLLTREAKPAGGLKDTAVSGDDLRDALATVECPVLLVLDACHSASAARTLRPATDDLTRSLTDDSVGVTVLAAAMSHEVAGATAENGHFTAGLLKGLAAGQGVPFDPYERQVYVHHLYAVAFSEVRRATGGKQNPFLNMPWTVPPVPVREVPAR